MPPCVCSARSAASKPASAHRYLAVLASRAAGFAVVVEPGGLAQHQLGGVEAGQRVGERELQALVHADRPAEHHALVAVARPRVAAPTRPMPSASAAISIRSGLSPSRMYLKPLPSSPTRSSTGTLQVVDEQLVGADGVAAHLGDRPDVDVVAVEVGEEQRHAVGLLGDLLELRGAGQQQDLLGLQRLGDPHLAAVDDVVVAVALGEGGDPRGVQPGAGLGDAEADVQVAVDDARQRARLELLGAVHDHRVHAEDRQVHRAGAVHRPRRSAATSSSSSEASVMPRPCAAVLLGDGDAEPAARRRWRRRTPAGTRAPGPSPSSSGRRTCPPDRRPHLRIVC